MKKALILFVRKPEKGKVKTRIAKDLGDDIALEVYKKLLQHTKQVTQNFEGDKFVFYAGGIVANDWWNACTKREQAPGDLGERMHTAFEELFGLGYANIVIIGSDCYELTTAILTQAFYALQQRDVVVGPSADGGYYLLGLKQPFAEIFADIAWSTETVCSETLRRIEHNGRTVAMLPMLHDVDTAEDCRRYVDLQPANHK